MYVDVINVLNISVTMGTFQVSTEVHSSIRTAFDIYWSESTLWVPNL
jgi:hypothetical protein